MPSYLLYLGLWLMFAGLVGSLRPLRWLGLGNRKRAALAVLSGLAAAACGLFWPYSREESAGITLLDEWQRESDFREIHSLESSADTARVFEAFKQVTFGELKIYSLLMSVRERALGRKPAVVTPNAPILETLASSGFVPLGERPGREVVMGLIMHVDSLRGRRATAEQFRDFCAPGWVKVAFNLRADPSPSGLTVISTQTRILGCGHAESTAFGRYWRFVYPGSALIRWMWLRTIEARASLLNGERHDRSRG